MRLKIGNIKANAAFAIMQMNWYCYKYYPHTSQFIADLAVKKFLKSDHFCGSSMHLKKKQDVIGTPCTKSNLPRVAITRSGRQTTRLQFKCQVFDKISYNAKTFLQRLGARGRCIDRRCSNHFWGSGLKRRKFQMISCWLDNAADFLRTSGR